MWLNGSHVSHTEQKTSGKTNGRQQHDDARLAKVTSVLAALEERSYNEATISMSAEK